MARLSRKPVLGVVIALSIVVILLLTGCETFLEELLFILETEVPGVNILVGTWTGEMIHRGIFLDSKTSVRIVIERQSGNLFYGSFERYVHGRWYRSSIQNPSLLPNGDLSFSWGHDNQHFFRGTLTSGRITGIWHDSSFFRREGTWSVSRVR